MSFLSPGPNLHRGFNIVFGDPGAHAACKVGPVWADMNMPLLTYQSAAWGNGVFMAGANSVGAARNTARSPDGTTWALSLTTANLNTGNVEQAVFGNGIFMIYGLARFNVSADADTWTDCPLLNGLFIAADLAFGNGLFVICDNGAAQVCATPNGATLFTVHATPVKFAGIVWDSSRNLWFGVEAGGVTSWSSPDLIAWTAKGILPAQGNSIQVGAGTLVAPRTFNAAFVNVSVDGGVTWTNQPIPFATILQKSGLHYQNGAWLAVQDGGFVSASVDALTWAATPSQITSQGAIPWRFVAGGATGLTYVAVPVKGGGSTVGAIGLC